MSLDLTTRFGDRPLLRDLCASPGEASRDVALLLASQGVSTIFDCLREIVSNAIDATLAAGGVSSAVLVRCSADRIEVSDAGMGFDAPPECLLLSPLATTKRHAAGTIGSMGIGFLTALSAVAWIQVATSDGRRFQMLRLGPVPADVTTEPGRGRGTTVSFGPLREVPSIREIQAALRRFFPFVPVEVRVGEVAGQTNPTARWPPPWSAPEGPQWQTWMVEALGLPRPLWTERGGRGNVKLVAWALGRHHPAGGSALVFQQGVHLDTLHEEVPCELGHRAIPPWMCFVADAPAVRPLLTRTALAAGADREELLLAVGTCLGRIVEAPPQPLLDRVAELQESFGSSWIQWLGSLRPDSPLRLATVWLCSDRTKRRLHEIPRRARAVKVLCGTSTAADLLWEDVQSLDRASEIFVRVSTDAEAEILVGSLRAIGVSTSLYDFRVGGPDEGSAPPPPAVRRLAQAVARHLEPLGIGVYTLSMSSPSLLGVFDPSGHAAEARPSAALIDEALDLRPRLERRQRALYLNSAAPVIQRLGQRHGLAPITRQIAYVVLAAIAAQPALAPEGAAEVGEAAIATTTFPYADDGSGADAPNHPTVFVIAPFRERKLLDVVRSVLEYDPYLAEVVRADDYVDKPELWSDVAVKIHRAQAYVCDLRGHNPNVMLEYGYVLAHAPARPCVLIRNHGERVADLDGKLRVNLPDDEGTWASHLRSALERYGISRAALPGKEAFLALRHLDPEVLASLERPIEENLYVFADGPRPTEHWLGLAHDCFRNRLTRFHRGRALYST